MGETMKDQVAVALRYEPGEDIAPRVTAKGRGYVAEKILHLARENGIPLRQDPDLVELLSQLKLDEAIPSEAYKIVAEILAFVYTLNEHIRKTKA
jgi:flagellar biosynthesis protein